MPKLTKAAALQVTARLDQLANIFQKQYGALGFSEKVARDFAFRCDVLADRVEKWTGVKRTAQLDPVDNYTESDLLPDAFDPSEIGAETTKPLLRNQDEPYMDTFRQEWFDELRTVQQTGQFSNAKVAAQAMRHMAQLLDAYGIPMNPRRRGRKG